MWATKQISLGGKILLLMGALAFGLPESSSQPTVSNKSILPTEPQTPTSVLAGEHIVILPGHGALARDPRTKKVKYDAGKEFFIKRPFGHVKYSEAQVTLSISKKLEANLKKEQAVPILSRHKNLQNKIMGAKEQAEFAKKQKGTVTVSIHVNAAANKDAHGVETFFYNDCGKDLAKFVHTRIVQQTGANDRLGRQFGFWVTAGTKKASILIEVGYGTNDQEKKRLVDERYQQKMADAITQGLIEYFESRQFQDGLDCTIPKQKSKSLDKVLVVSFNAED